MMSKIDLTRAPEESFPFGDFGLLGRAELHEWELTLTHQVLEKLDHLPLWKQRESIGPIQLTIACLVEDGLLEPQAIKNYFEQALVK